MLDLDANNTFLMHMFNRDKGVAHVQDMLKYNVNPYMAVAYQAGLTADVIAQKLDMSLNQISALMDGKLKPSRKTVINFCDLAGVTPDALHFKSSLMPADHAILAAAVYYVELLRGQTIPAPLLSFLHDERMKAGRMGAQSLYQGMPNNFAMLRYAQEIAATYAPHLKDHHSAYDETASPSAVNRGLHMVVEFAASGRWLKPLPSKATFEKGKARYKKHRRAMTNALYALVPGNIETAQAWFKAFQNKVDELGFNFAAAMVKEDAGSFYPIKRYGSKSSMTLENGDYISGYQVVEEFCIQYQRNTQDLLYSETYERLEENMLGKVDQLVELRRWAGAAATETFLYAEAGQRHICGHLDYDELALPIAVEEPVGRVSVMKAMNVAPK